MISRSGFSVTYVPGAGYSAKPQNKPDSNVSICWGDEFQKNLKETLSKEAHEFRVEQQEFIRSSLSKEEIRELAGQFDPHRMSQGEYDQFLDILVEKGVITPCECRQMGYNGLIQVCPDDEYKYGYFTGCTNSSIKSLKNGTNLFGIDGMDGDVLSWVKLKSLGIIGNGTVNPTYTAILEILNQMKS